MITSLDYFYYIGHTTSLDSILWLNWNINCSNILKCELFLIWICLSTTSICYNSLCIFLLDLRILLINFYSLYYFLPTAIKSHLTCGGIGVEFINSGFFCCGIFIFVFIAHHYWAFLLFSTTFMSQFWGETLRGNDTELKKKQIRKMLFETGNKLMEQKVIYANSQINNRSTSLKKNVYWSYQSVSFQKWLFLNTGFSLWRRPIPTYAVWSTASLTTPQDWMWEKCLIV